MMDKIKMAEKLWDLANLVTGFAVVQSIATTFTIAKNDLKQSLVGPGPHVAAMVVTLIFTLFYIIAILWCGKNGSSQDSTGNSSTWRTVTIGRVIAVILFTLVTLGTLGGHWRDGLRGKPHSNSGATQATSVK